MIANLWILFDLLLAVLVVALGWAAVASADLKRAVVLFIAFGLLLAIIWARLNAPDLARSAPASPGHCCWRRCAMNPMAAMSQASPGVRLPGSPGY